MLINLSLLAVAILLILVIYEDRHSHSKYHKVRWKVIIISMGVWFICGLGSIIIPNLTYEEKVQTNKYDVLQSVADEQAIKKSKLGEEDIYIFFFQSDDEYWQIENTPVPAIKICTVRADDSTIYESDIDKPYVIEYTIYTKNILNDFWRKLLLGHKIGATSENKTYDIFIPKGTFIGDFDTPIPATNIFNVSED